MNWRERIVAIKAAQSRKKMALAERLAQLREDRNAEMDLWDDSSPQIEEAFYRLQAMIERCPDWVAIKVA
jgi:hypothetical protein